MRNLRILLNLCLIPLAATDAYCQKPEIAPLGIVNAANYYAGGYVGRSVMPGSIVSIFGKNLATSTESATTIPLPRSLSGTSVIVAGQAAPIFFVSPGQINIQFPSNAPKAGSVVVSSPAGSSEPAPYDLNPNSGLFTLDGSGCGRGVVFNVASDGSLSLNSPSNSAAPGDTIAVFGTGISSVRNPPPDGEPSPTEPLATGDRIASDFDLSSGAFVTFNGRVPGLIGVDQANISIPDTVREGCGVPVQLTDGLQSTSQPVPVSIRKGGGQCVDPPTAGYGQITWEKNIPTGPDSSSAIETITAELKGSPGKKAPRVSPLPLAQVLLFPSCPLPGYRGLDAGRVTATAPNSAAVPLGSTTIDWQAVYRAVLPSGTIRPGGFQIAASGGDDVAPFESSLKIGSEIRLTSSFPPGTVISRLVPLTVTWTGGDPDSWVTVTLFTHNRVWDSYALQKERASAGKATIRTSEGGGNIIPFIPINGGPSGEIVVEVTPDPSEVPALTVPGLSLGGQHTWKYTYRFGGLTIH